MSIYIYSVCSPSTSACLPRIPSSSPLRRLASWWLTRLFFKYIRAITYDLFCFLSSFDHHGASAFCLRSHILQLWAIHAVAPPHTLLAQQYLIHSWWTLGRWVVRSADSWSHVSKMSCACLCILTFFDIGFLRHSHMQSHEVTWFLGGRRAAALSGKPWSEVKKSDKLWQSTGPCCPCCPCEDLMASPLCLRPSWFLSLAAWSRGSLDSFQPLPCCAALSFWKFSVEMQERLRKVQPFAFNVYLWNFWVNMWQVC